MSEQTSESNESVLDMSIERLSRIAKKIIDGADVDAKELRNAQALSSFVTAASAGFLADEIQAAIGGTRSVLSSIAPMAKMAAMSAGVAGGAWPSDVPSVGIPSEPGESFLSGLGGIDGPPQEQPSWVQQVLQAEASQGIAAGKKTIAITIDMADKNDAGPEQVELLGRMKAEGWTLEQLNEKLAACPRPSQARIVEDPAAV